MNQKKLIILFFLNQLNNFQQKNVVNEKNWN